jgi:hypothetical protein
VATIAVIVYLALSDGEWKAAGGRTPGQAGPTSFLTVCYFSASRSFWNAVLA